MSLVGHYADLTFITEAQVLERPSVILAREAWLGRFLAAVFPLGLGCGVPVFTGAAAFTDAEWRFEVSAGALFDLVLASIGSLAVVVVALVCLLAGFAFLTEAVAARRSGSWVLHAKLATLNPGLFGVNTSWTEKGV